MNEKQNIPKMCNLLPKGRGPKQTELRIFHTHTHNDSVFNGPLNNLRSQKKQVDLPTKPFVYLYQKDQVIHGRLHHLAVVGAHDVPAQDDQNVFASAVSVSLWRLNHKAVPKTLQELVRSATTTTTALRLLACTSLQLQLDQLHSCASCGPH